MDQIHDNIWVSDIKTVREQPLPDGVNKVITVCQDSVEDNVGCEYSHYNMADGEVDIYGGRSDYGIFHEAADELLQSVRDGHSVVVHCHMGQSRSVAVCMAVLAVVEGIRVHEARGRIKDVREQVHPNDILTDHVKKFVASNGEN